MLNPDIEDIHNIKGFFSEKIMSFEFNHKILNLIAFILGMPKSVMSTRPKILKI